MAQNRTYNFRARDEKNHVITGVIQAATLEEATRLLIKKKYSPISVAVPKNWSDVLPFLGKVNQKQVTVFARQLSTMLEAGLNITQAMRLLVEQAGSTRFQTIMESILADIQEGFSFSSSLAKHDNAFDTVFVNAVKAGESTGKLDTVLAQLATTKEKTLSVSGKIRGALIYPAFILTAMVVVAALMLTMVVPQLKSIFDSSGQSLPAQTQFLLWLSAFFVSYWGVVLGLIVVVVLGVHYYLRTETGAVAFSRLVLRLPVIASITERSAMAQIGRLLGILLSSGVPLLDALRMIEQALGNRVYRAAIHQVAVEVERGVPMSVPITKNQVFPAMLAQMVSVGEQTGKMDEVVTRMALYYEGEVETEVGALASLIEPVTIVVLGIGVAWLVMAILIPVYQISSTVS